eukprot:jgi/Antlo1/2565/676
MKQSILDKVLIFSRKGRGNTKSRVRGVDFVGNKVHEETNEIIDAHSDTMLREVTEDVNCVSVRDRIYLVAQCWNNRTLFRSKRNNARELARFLHDKFGEKYMVWRFVKEDGISSAFRNVQVFLEPDFSLNLALSVAKTTKTWLEMDKRHVAVIEKRGCDSKMAFVLTCIIKYCHSQESIFNIYESLLLKGAFSKSFSTGSCLQFLKSFETLFRTSAATTKKYNIHILHQIIISREKEELLDIGCNMVLKICLDGNKVINIEDPKSIYQDEFYLIFFIRDLEIVGDVKLVLLSKKRAVKKIFEAYFNTFFINEEVIRLRTKEIEVNSMAYADDIMVDIVLRKDKESTNMPYSVTENILEGFKLLGDHYFGRETPCDLKKLVEKGYNKTISRFCLQLGMSVYDVERFIKEFSERGNKNLLISPRKSVHDRVVRITKENVCERTERESQTEVSYKETEVDHSKMRYFASNAEYNLETLEPLDENSDSKHINARKPSNVLRPPPKRKTKIEHKKPALIAKRPLHFISLSTPNISIFNDLENLEVNFDVEKFESWFCEPESKKNTDSMQKHHTGVLDSRRVFLVQIGLKALEKKGIKPDHLNSVLNFKHQSLEIEDLLNIKQLFLKEGEESAILQADIGELTQIERYMVLVSRNTSLKRGVQILLFERLFSGEPLLISETIKKIEYVLANLVESNAVKLILKHVLEIVNAVNYKYTTTKKKTKSFRLSCLKQLWDYRGKNNNQTLFRFLVESLANNKSQLTKELVVFDMIEAVKDEDLGNLKCRINEFLRNHKSCVEMLKEMDDMDELKAYLSKVLGYSFEFLKSLKELYMKVDRLSYVVQEKFCDVDDMSLNGVLRDFSDFFASLKKALNE